MSEGHSGAQTLKAGKLRGREQQTYSLGTARALMWGTTSGLQHSVHTHREKMQQEVPKGPWPQKTPSLDLASHPLPCL